MFLDLRRAPGQLGQPRGGLPTSARKLGRRRNIADLAKLAPDIPLAGRFMVLGQFKWLRLGWSKVSCVNDDGPVSLALDGYTRARITVTEYWLKLVDKRAQAQGRQIVLSGN